LKGARLRPQASRDREDAVRYYRKVAGPVVAKNLVEMCESALDLIERQPGIGSPVFGNMLGIPELRSRKVAHFPVLWFCFEGDDHGDVIRLLGERQDIATSLANSPDRPV
jgi:toxin ParE1/3/4